VNTARSLWASIQNDPHFMQRFHGWVTILWLLAIPLSVYWRESVIWIVFLSHYAIVTGHWSSWQAARVEVKQEEQSG
jgi:hypothetical protein